MSCLSELYYTAGILFKNWLWGPWTLWCPWDRNEEADALAFWMIPGISYFRPEVLKRFQKLLGFLGNTLFCLFLKPLHYIIFSVFGWFIKKFLWSLSCWQKFKNVFELSASKLIKNYWFFFLTKSCLVLMKAQ
jgi:hypothetical protein